MLTDIFGRRRPRVANRLGRSRRLLPAACLASAMMGFGSWSVPATAQDLIAVTGHFLHHSRFYPQYGPYWRVDLTLPLVKELGVCGTKSGRDIDKFAACHLTQVQGRTVDVPVIGQAWLHMECKVMYKSDMTRMNLDPAVANRFYGDLNHHTLYMAEVTDFYEFE